MRKATSPILNSKRLIEALQLLQVNPLIEKISAELNQGSGFGKALLNVRVKARQPFKAEIILDNSRSPAVGSFQRRLQVTDANLLGLGDKLTVGYRNTDGSNALEAGYSVPINSQNGTIEFGYINVSSSIIKYPFNKIDILSNARAYELTFRQPLLQQALSNASREFALGLTASRQESETSLLNTPFPLSPGADERGRTRISALRFFQEWTQRSNQQVFFTRSQFSLGVGAFNSTSQFFSWRGQIELLKRLGDVSLLLRGNLQLADRSLAPLEQFGLGGVATVRGYSQDALLTDNGFLFSTEVHIPVKIGEGSELQVIPFADVGTAWNNNGTRELTNTSKSGTLASFGLGIQYQLGERLNARLDWGIPLVPFATSKSNSWQENGLYFFIRYKLL